MTKAKYPKTPEGEAAKLKSKADASREAIRRRFPSGYVTKAMLRGQSPTVIQDGDAEATWFAEGAVHIPGWSLMSHQERRRRALRLAQAHALRDAADVAPNGVDDKTTEIYLRQFAEDRHRTADRDLKMSAKHRREAEQAERDLGALLLARESRLR